MGSRKKRWLCSFFESKDALLTADVFPSLFLRYFRPGQIRRWLSQWFIRCSSPHARLCTGISSEKNFCLELMQYGVLDNQCKMTEEKQAPLWTTSPSSDCSFFWLRKCKTFFFFFSGHHVHGSSCLCVRSCEFGGFFYQSGGIWKVHDEVSGTAEWHSPAGRLPVGRHTAEIFTPALTNPSHAVVPLGTPGRNAAPRHFCALLDPWHCKATVTPETCSEESTYKRLRAV